jgi:hypothetical protein
MGFDEDIAKQEEAIRKADSELESAASALRGTIVSFAREWIQREVGRYVKGVGSTRTEQIGTKGVQNLRTGLEKVLNNVPSRVEASFRQMDRLFKAPPRPMSTRFPKSYQAGPTHDFEEQNRLVLGDAGRVLADQGYVQLNPTATTSGYRPVAGGIRYQYHIEYSDGLSAAIRRYSDLLESKDGEKTKLGELRARKSQSHASSIWDQT